jgi:hypothetical protein
MGKPRFPSLLLSTQLLVSLGSLSLHCHRPVEVQKGDYLLHATPEPLPDPAPVPPPTSPPSDTQPDPEYHAE